MRKKYLLQLLFTCTQVIIGSYAYGQHSQPDTLVALRTVEHLELDGVLDEPCWQRAIHITNFTQRDPVQGEPGTDLTDVAVVYDSLALYVGAVLPVGDPEHMQAKYMQRDFAWYADDNFQFVISTFNDHRNGYLFVTNPNGARGDMQVSPNSGFNTDWNGVWNVVTTCTDIGWTAEFRIPFNTLQFPKDSVQTWGLNFERNVRSKNEQVNWQGWGRNTSVNNLANAGTLSGITNIGYAKRFEFKPFALGGLQQVGGEKDDLIGKLGGDLNVNITPTLKLNLTANTDFAQVEADRIPVNLSRFNLYYPEKRAFFLEGSGNYAFNLGNANTVFYSRRIGIEQLKQVPVLGGVRLFGKLGRNNIGVLSLETGKAEGVPATNNTVLRYSRDLGTQSRIGGILTSKINDGVSNQVAGIDGAYATSKFLGNKALEVGVAVAQGIRDGRTGSDGLAYRIYADYPNDLFDHFIALSSIQKNFDPDLGFLQRTNYEALNWNLAFEPRWFTKLGVRKMEFAPFEIDVFREAGTGNVQTASLNTRPFGFLWKSGDEFGLNFTWLYDNVPQAFNLSDSISIGSGAYNYHETTLYFSTFNGRRVKVEFVPTMGTFYNGRKTTLESTLKFNFSKRFNLSVEHTWNDLRFRKTENRNAQQLITNELALYPTYTFTTNLTVSVFAQWNSLSDFVRMNARLHWIPRIGTDLFLVFDQTNSPSDHIDFDRPTSRSVVGKLVWRIVF